MNGRENNNFEIENDISKNLCLDTYPQEQWLNLEFRYSYFCSQRTSSSFSCYYLKFLQKLQNPLENNLFRCIYGMNSYTEIRIQLINNASRFKYIQNYKCYLVIWIESATCPSVPSPSLRLKEYFILCFVSSTCSSSSPLLNYWFFSYLHHTITFLSLRRRLSSDLSRRLAFALLIFLW